MKKIILLFIVCVINLTLCVTRSFAQVVINEFLVDPQPQAVELINTGSENVDISNWYIDDSGGTTYFTIVANTLLLPHSCMVFYSDFNLNRSSQDTIRLFNSASSPSSSSPLDSFFYKSSPGPGISFFRVPDGAETWATGEATLGKSNETDVSCEVLPTETPQPTNTPTATTKPSQSSPTPTPTSSPTQTPTPTILSPTPLLKGPKTLTPPTTSSFIRNTSVLNNSQSDEGEVLGFQDKASGKNKAATKALSFFSLSLAILTLLSVSLKMRGNA